MRWMRMRMRMLVAVSLAGLATVLLTACSGAEEPAIPSVGDTSTAPAPIPDLYTRELEFVACMREQGVLDMPDPVPGDPVGRSALRYAMSVMGKASDPLFQSALEVCLGLLPAPPPAQPRPPDEIEALRQFARCLRDNGVYEFPDPGPAGELIVVLYPDDGVTNAPSGPIRVEGEDAVVLNLEDPVVAAAWAACRDAYPASTHGWDAL